ncbi:MAG: GNAT family N-acetyltransferase [Saprospiraceae bacterium]|nr:GNAT family N-acetyltransferase [Saprospiraceae bacterium]
METIIEPIDKEKIKAELTKDKFVRITNNGNKEIYIITHHDSPNTMMELGRLREVTFRDAGGGTGKAYDIDSYDTAEVPFKQLIVWNPNDEDIVGGYRFIEGYNIKLDENKSPISATAKLFNFSDKFIKDFMPYMIELGRSFVQPNYQPSFNIRKGIYSLDNLWDGLGAVIVDNPDIKYYFGKITMYSRFNITARDLILFFLHKHFPDTEGLVYPFKPVEFQTEIDYLDRTFIGKNFDDDYKILMKNVRRLGESVPPLVNAYMTLSPSMKTFGTAINPSFGKVEETGILVTIDDIYDFKKERHISEYKKKEV